MYGAIAILLVVFSPTIAFSAEKRGLERQALETEYFDGEFKSVFIAIRSTFQNEGFIVEQSDLPTGLLVLSKDYRYKNAKTASVLAVLPGGGAIYVGSYGLAVLDILLWPYSVAWEIPIVATKARGMTKENTVSATLVDLGDKVEVRTTLAGKKVDAQYVVSLKRLYADARKQMMIRDRPEGRPDERIAKDIKEFIAIERLKGREKIDRGQLVDYLLGKDYDATQLSSPAVAKMIQENSAQEGSPSKKSTVSKPKSTK